MIAISLFGIAGGVVLLRKKNKKSN